MKNEWFQRLFFWLVHIISLTHLNPVLGILVVGLAVRVEVDGLHERQRLRVVNAAFALVGADRNVLRNEGRDGWMDGADGGG